MLEYRKIRIDDAEELFEFTSDYETGYWCGWKPHDSLRKHVKL